MNERIRLLAEQAFFDENTNQPSDKMYTFTEHKMKQFAELIVRECMQVLDPGEHQLIARFQARKWLAEHFGVAE
jgi:hypothetical protein